MSRTQQEIVERIEALSAEDLFGFQKGDLIDHLDFEHAKPYLKDTVTIERWYLYRTNVLPPLGAARDYMEFAFEKCVGHRGNSAGRSIEHFKAWIWLAGDDETLAFLDDHSHYTNYGAPMLAKLAKVLGVSAPEDAAFQRMARGTRCGVSNDCGCA